MKHRNIFHHIKFIIVLCMVLGVGLVAGGVYYINQSGINDEWRQRIALELENLGIVADFESLRFDLTHGLVATGVRIYADNKRDDIVASLEHLVIGVDKTKLMRGKIRVIDVSLSKADISLPINPEIPSGPRIIMSDLQGDMFLPDKRTLEAREIDGFVAGIRVSINGRIWSEQPAQAKDPERIRQGRIERMQLIDNIIREIGRWNWPDDKPPSLKLYVEANMDNPDTARIDFVLEAPELERRGLTLTDIEIRGDFNNRMVTFDTVRLKDNAGALRAKVAYRPASQTARFEADSSLHIQRLSRKLFGVNIMSQLTFSTPPSITCTGKISLNKDNESKLEALITGHATIKDFTFLGSRFRQLQTDFSSQGRDAFLTGLHAVHDEGELKGRILLKNAIVRYEAESTLPPSAYNAFLADTGVDKALSQASFTPQSKLYIESRGTMNRNNLTKWDAEGRARIENFSYKDTPLLSLSGDYSMNELRSQFENIKADFNYEDYVLRRTYGGPSSAPVSASSITVDREQRAVSLENINGTAWPAPIVRLFVSKAADHVEKYRFHRPPNLSASGVFDLDRPFKRTNFTINVSNPGSMHYDFINEPLTLNRLKSKVQILGDRVNVTNLSFTSFQGACSGNISVHTSSSRKSQYQGDIQFRRLHLKDIGQLYQFKNAERGLLTGRIDFSGQGNQMRKFNGKGSLALEKGNLFSVPMLGPISQLMGTVLGDRNPTQENAKDASCTYIIRDGVVYSNDFLATTRSLKFTGEGNIDLEEREIDLLVRMNARGLFGFLALPLRPFMGLFQFKGDGPITKPEWDTAIFTPPPEGKDHPIFRKPPKAKIIAE